MLLPLRLHWTTGLWPYSFPYERSQESHWAQPRGSIAIRVRARLAGAWITN